MRAMMKANTNPTASPKRIPSGTEFTLRAKIPAATPAMRPLIVEPITIITIPERTAGVNQAVPPSMAPSTAPSSNPSKTLFILSSTLCLPFFTTHSRIPLTLSVQKQQNEHTHRQVRQNQQDKEAVAAVKAPGLLECRLAAGAHSQAVEVARDVQRQLRNAGVTARGVARAGFRADGFQRLVEFLSVRIGRSRGRIGEQESQKRAE